MNSSMQKIKVHVESEKEREKHRVTPPLVSEHHKPNLSSTKKSEGEKNLVMLGTKSEMREFNKDPNLVHFVLLYKDALLLTNNMNFLPSGVSCVLQEFSYVFLTEVPAGLPLIRGIEYQIDLIPSVTLPNRPPYHTNPEEMKEIQKQVQEILSKGYVRESLRPSAVPLSLVPKKDDTWCMCIDCRVINNITI